MVRPKFEDAIYYLNDGLALYYVYIILLMIPSRILTLPLPSPRAAAPTPRRSILKIEKKGTSITIV